MYRTIDTATWTFDSILNTPNQAVDAGDVLQLEVVGQVTNRATSNVLGAADTCVAVIQCRGPIGTPPKPLKLPMYCQPGFTPPESTGIVVSRPGAS